jgi:pyruvate/2-oxoglutarate dehydrogenase complex dihydrolipoamide dehydrogenase (E3) component
MKRIKERSHMKPPDYDLAIIGAGASGLIAVDFALQLGARTALIDKGLIGGDCTWTGCVPSKSLIKVATVANHVRLASRYGIECSAQQVDMNKVRAYLRGTIEQIYEPTKPENLEKKGMDVILGTAAFVDPHTLRVGERTIRASKFLINTGAEPKLPPIEGLSSVPFLTYQQVFDNDLLPEHLIVIGGGPIGCEIAQAYRRLGAQVTIIAEHLIPKEDDEVSALIDRVFAEERIGRFVARAQSISGTAGSIVVSTAAGDITGDMLLIATGRAPQVHGLGLERAGVRYSDHGIQVDAYLRTTARHIYAAGDVIGGPQYSHLAGWQGFQAVRNALLPGNNKGMSESLSRITFTSPEVAQVGLTERAARKQFAASDLQVMTFDITRVDRAVNEDDRLGLLKIIALRNGRILGAVIVGERAGETITELALAIRNRLKLADLAATIHPYPTYSSGVQFLATQMAMEGTFSRGFGRFVRALSKVWALTGRHSFAARLRLL